jgi:hypoxanthine-DNA glycosylase
MEEIHPFESFYSENATLLIIGSFPCFNGSDYGDWYYGGSGKNYFWQILSDIYKTTTNTLDQKKELCTLYSISLTDILYKIERRQNNCSDSNLRIIEFNKAGIEKCLTKNLKKILFTSKFVEKHFRKLFPNNLIPTHTLPSPSPTANRAIARMENYIKLRSESSTISTYAYRVLQFKQALQ